MKIDNCTNSRSRRNDDEEEEIQSTERYLGYFTRVKTQTCITVPIDEGVREAVYYRQVAKAIAELKDTDQVEFEIASPGGYLDGLTSILTALEKTEATSVAYINGECHSAASILAMNCDVVYVSPYATMLVHFVQFGASGKGTDVRSKVNHVYETCVSLFKNTYKYFLTERELADCIEGKEFWLSSSEIQQRLQRKFESMDKQVKIQNRKTRKSKAPKDTSEVQSEE